MSKHTPGPWALKYGTQIFSAADPHINVATANRFSSLEAQQANARLIAAAPELLAMVESLRGYLTDGYEDEDAYEREMRDADLRAMDALFAKIRP